MAVKKISKVQHEKFEFELKIFLSELSKIVLLLTFNFISFDEAIDHDFVTELK